MTTTTITENGGALPDGGPAPDGAMRWWRIGVLAVVLLALAMAALAAVFGRPAVLIDGAVPASADQQRTLVESTARDDYLTVVHAIAALRDLSVTDVPDLHDFQAFLPVSTRFAATRSLPENKRLEGWERQVLLLNKKIFHLRHEFHTMVKQSYVWLQVFQWISIIISAATTLVVALNTHGLTAGAARGEGEAVPWLQRRKWALGMAALLLSTVTTVVGSVGSFYGPQQDFATKSSKLAGLTALHGEIAFAVARLDRGTDGIEKSRIDDWIKRYTEISVSSSNAERKQSDSESTASAMQTPG